MNFSEFDGIFSGVNFAMHLQLSNHSVSVEATPFLACKTFVVDGQTVNSSFPLHTKHNIVISCSDMVLYYASCNCIYKVCTRYIQSLSTSHFVNSRFVPTWSMSDEVGVDKVKLLMKWELTNLELTKWEDNDLCLGHHCCLTDSGIDRFACKM